MFRVILTLLIVLSLYSIGYGCTLTWDVPTTYTDGTPVPSTEVITYRLYFTPQGTIISQVVYEGVSNTTTLVCTVGSYYVIAYTVSDIESDKSNTVVVRKIRAPVDLKRSK